MYQEMHATIVEDGGTGRLIRDPVSFTGIGKQPVAQQPNLDTGAPVATFGGNPPSGETGGDQLMYPGGNVSGQLPQGPEDGAITTLPIAKRLPNDPPPTPPGVGPPTTTSGDQTQTGAGFGASKDVLDAISATAANAGANQMLGPQFSYGPGTTTTTTSGGGSPILIMAAIAIVGVLLFLHFRKKHAEHS